MSTDLVSRRQHSNDAFSLTLISSSTESNMNDGHLLRSFSWTFARRAGRFAWLVVLIVCTVELGGCNNQLGGFLPRIDCRCNKIPLSLAQATSG